MSFHKRNLEPRRAINLLAVSLILTSLGLGILAWGIR